MGGAKNWKSQQGFTCKRPPFCGVLSLDVKQAQLERGGKGRRAIQTSQTWRPRKSAVSATSRVEKSPARNRVSEPGARPPGDPCASPAFTREAPTRRAPGPGG